MILGYMFRFTRNHNQALPKIHTSLHKTNKTRFGTPIRVLLILCNGCVYFREGLMMIPSESKHVAQDH